MPNPYRLWLLSGKLSRLLAAEKVALETVDQRMLWTSHPEDFDTEAVLFQEVVDARRSACPDRRHRSRAAL